MYAYDLNIIWFHPIKSQEGPDLITRINACYQVLDDANIKPIIYRLDNEISDDIICVIKKRPQISNYNCPRPPPAPC